MATKNEKHLAQMVFDLCDVMDLFKPAITEAYNAKVEQLEAEGVEKTDPKWDSILRIQQILGNDNPIKKGALDILSQEDTVEVKSSPKGDNRFSYTGLEFIPEKNEETVQAEYLAKRKEQGVITFTVSRGGNLILTVHYNDKLKKIMTPTGESSEDGKPKYRAAINCPFPVTKNAALRTLKQWAEKEIEEPGWFNKTYIDCDD